MADIKPLYLDPSTGLATESDPTQDTVAFARVSVPAPTADTDAANKAYVDANAHGGTGGISLTMVELDAGPVPVPGAEVAVVDARVTPQSVILAQVSGVPPENKDPDEVGMDLYSLLTTPGDGQITFYLRGLQGYIHDKFNVVYLMGTGA